MKEIAIVLPGAVARGAYEAGVIQALAEKEVKIRRIVATSSGALNGLALAVSIRNGQEKEIAEQLINSWLNRGSWAHFFKFHIWGIFSGKGLSSQKNLLKIMRDLIKPCDGPKKQEVELRIIVTPLNGIEKNNGKDVATTYEQVIEFNGPDFDTTEGLEKIFNVVSAACAFPGLFGSVTIPHLGKCVDGGVVNNAPIKYAVENSDVGLVLAPIPFPLIMPKANWGGGFSLLNHLIAILINERLFRDLQISHSINRQAQDLYGLIETGIISEAQCEKIKSTLMIESTCIIEIRPTVHMNCSPFSPFLFRRERQQLIEEGKKSALRAIAQLPQHE